MVGRSSNLSKDCPEYSPIQTTTGLNMTSKGLSRSFRGRHHSHNQNIDLDSLTYGGSLGAEPLHTDLKKAKLRSGPLEGSGQGLKGRIFGNGKEVPHVKFRFKKGVQKRVGCLRKCLL